MNYLACLLQWLTFSSPLLYCSPSECQLLLRSFQVVPNCCHLLLHCLDILCIEFLWSLHLCILVQSSHSLALHLCCRSFQIRWSKSCSPLLRGDVFLGRPLNVMPCQPNTTDTELFDSTNQWTRQSKYKAQHLYSLLAHVQPLPKAIVLHKD